MCIQPSAVVRFSLTVHERPLPRRIGRVPFLSAAIPRYVVHTSYVLSVHSFYNLPGNTLLALCASITEDFLDETKADVHDKPSLRQSEKPQTLRRKHSMCPLVKGGCIGSVRDFQVELAEVVSRPFLLPDVAQDTESTTSEELYSDLSHTASLVEVVDTGCPPPSPPLSIPSRTLTQIIKEYWIGKCRSRPASRGHPSLDTIDELPDADTHDIPMPSCQIFGHPMVRTKAKRPVRRPKMRAENENMCVYMLFVVSEAAR